MMSDLDLMVREEYKIPDEVPTDEWCKEHGYDYRTLLIKAYSLMLYERKTVSMYIEKLISELKRQVKTYKYVDVGVGAEDIYCVSRERFNHALKLLMKEGYSVITIELESNENPYLYTTKILSANPIPQKDIDEHRKQWTMEHRAIVDAKYSHDTYSNIFKYHLLDSFSPRIYEDENLVIQKMDRCSELRFCSRLISLMCRRGAKEDEIANIIKYSMVVLDAEKHCLNWKKAAEDFKVMDMAKQYMPKPAVKT